MMDHIETYDFLADATPTRLVKAAAANHTEWFVARALAAGGESHHTNGVAWTETSQEIVIAFPLMAQARAGQILDTILEVGRRRKLRKASCWSLSPSHPRDLGVQIAARGFEWGWRPHWMALDLHEMQATSSLLNGLRIAVDDEADWSVEDLPYYDREESAYLRILTQSRPRRVWHLGAWLDDRIVGQSTLFLTTGQLGVAGIYNVGVVPSARNRGIGAAISLAACHLARTLGCRYALLNSAADRLYERLGFASLGYGQTWWMHAPGMSIPPPSAAQIAFVEALGRGDVAALAALASDWLPADLDSPLPNGMLPMDLAIRTRKTASAEWLVTRGATLNILHAWDLDWKDLARRLLSDQPGLANDRAGAWQLTPLHEAVKRDDIALARLLLTANPDLEIQDTQFHSTPLGWARHLQRREIMTLIQDHKS